MGFSGTAGPWNAITDVPGVEVGYATLIEGDGVRTGVTAIHPRGRSNPGDPCAAGFHSLNGNGEMTGGTASRVVESGGARFTVGVLVQANFGTRRELTIAGVPVGEALADDNPMDTHFSAPPGAGSVISVVATDAPLLPDQCRALARRVTLGLARTGTTGSHFSGDLFLVFSTANAGAFTPTRSTIRAHGRGGHDSLQFIPWGYVDPFFAAVAQSTEEAVVNALVANEAMVGFRGHRVPALPRDRLVELLRLPEAAAAAGR